MDLSAVTKMPPQRLMLVVGGGVAAGLLWRKFSKKTAAPAFTVPESTVPEDYLAPNRAADNNRRDQLEAGGIQLPVSQWIVSIGGQRYLTSDGVNFTPIDGTTGIPGVPGASNPDTAEGRHALGLDDTGSYSGKPGELYLPITDLSYWQELSAEQRAELEAMGYTVPGGGPVNLGSGSGGGTYYAS